MKNVNESLINFHVQNGNVLQTIKAARHNSREIRKSEWQVLLSTYHKKYDPREISNILSQLHKKEITSFLKHLLLEVRDFEMVLAHYIKAGIDFNPHFCTTAFNRNAHNAGKDRDYDFRQMELIANYAYDTFPSVETMPVGKTKISVRYYYLIKITQLALIENRAEFFLSASAKLNKTPDPTEIKKLIIGSINAMTEKTKNGIKDLIPEMKHLPELIALLPQKERQLINSSLFD